MTSARVVAAGFISAGQEPGQEDSQSATTMADELRRELNCSVDDILAIVDIIVDGWWYVMVCG